ncbi:hypothetical protein [Streptomyces sp. NPDC001985]|uniref:hypothetical protein n=1 Tax=Streptomyces sp. NPDC001985 TaxID=3154406 RepID=UPI00332B201E
MGREREMRREIRMAEGDEARHGASQVPARPAASPEDLPGLLALLGRLLEDRAPAEVAVLLREELDRREIAAYASGWRDAVAEYGPALEEARAAAAAARPLRLVGRTPGQAAVIPFPQDERGRYPADGGAGDDPAGRHPPDPRTAAGGPERDHPARDSPRHPHPRSDIKDMKDGMDGEDAIREARHDQHDQHDQRARQNRENRENREDHQHRQDQDTGTPTTPPPSLAPKSRKSKVPTIPRLDSPSTPAARSRRPRREPPDAPDAHAPPEAPVPPVPPDPPAAPPTPPDGDPA